MDTSNTLNIEIDQDPSTGKYLYFVGLTDEYANEMIEIGSGDAHNVESLMKMINDLVRRTL